MLVAPTQSLVAPAVADILDDPAADMAMVGRILRWTVPCNDLGLCAVSLPIHHLGPTGTLPVGLQLHMAPGRDASVAGLKGKDLITQRSYNSSYNSSYNYPFKSEQRGHQTEKVTSGRKIFRGSRGLT